MKVSSKFLLAGSTALYLLSHSVMAMNSNDAPVARGSAFAARPATAIAPNDQSHSAQSQGRSKKPPQTNKEKRRNMRKMRAEDRTRNKVRGLSSSSSSSSANGFVRDDRARATQTSASVVAAVPVPSSSSSSAGYRAHDEWIRVPVSAAAAAAAAAAAPSSPSSSSYSSVHHRAQDWQLSPASVGKGVVAAVTASGLPTDTSSLDSFPDPLLLMIAGYANGMYMLTFLENRCLRGKQDIRPNIEALDLSGDSTSQLASLTDERLQPYTGLKEFRLYPRAEKGTAFAFSWDDPRYSAFRLPDTVTDNAFKGMPRLTVLELSGSQFTDNAVNNRCDVTNIILHGPGFTNRVLPDTSRLNSLGLRGNQFTSDVITLRCPGHNALPCNFSTLESVYLYGDQFDDNALRGHRFFTSLGLCGPKFTDAAVAGMNRLTHLILKGNFTNTALVNKPFLRFLELSAPLCTDEAIADKNDLKSLRLDQGQFTRNAAMNKPFLEHFHLNGEDDPLMYKFDPVIFACIADYLPGGQAMRFIDHYSPYAKPYVSSLVFKRDDQRDEEETLRMVTDSSLQDYTGVKIFKVASPEALPSCIWLSSKVTDKAVQRMKELEDAFIAGTEFTNKVFTGLHKLKSVTLVSGPGCRLTDAAVAGMTQLTSIRLYGNRFSNRAVAGMTKLTHATFCSDTMTDEAFANLPYLTSLELRGNQFTHDGVARLKNLKKVALDGPQFSDATVTGMTQLRSLTLEGRFTVAAAANKPFLQSFELYGEPVLLPYTAPGVTSSGTGANPSYSTPSASAAAAAAADVANAASSSAPAEAYRKPTSAQGQG